MGQMTEEHIREFAKTWLSLHDEEIVRIVQASWGIYLDWETSHGVGTITVKDDSVTLADDNGSRPQNADLHELCLIASWGYDVMMEDER